MNDIEFAREIHDLGLRIKLKHKYGLDDVTEDAVWRMASKGTDVADMKKRYAEFVLFAEMLGSRPHV